MLAKGTSMPCLRACTCSDDGETCEWCVEEDKYGDDDPSYRLSVDPSIEQWCNSGYFESLVGLKLELGFGHLGEFAAGP